MKILIFGIVASGKTTLARKLSKELSIPYFEGDCIPWGFQMKKDTNVQKRNRKKLLLK